MGLTVIKVGLKTDSASVSSSKFVETCLFFSISFNYFFDGLAAVTAFRQAISSRASRRQYRDSERSS